MLMTLKTAMQNGTAAHSALFYIKTTNKTIDNENQ